MVKDKSRYVNLKERLSLNFSNTNLIYLVEFGQNRQFLMTGGQKEKEIVSWFAIFLLLLFVFCRVDCPRVTNCFTPLLLFQDTSADNGQEDRRIKVCFIIQRDPGFRLGYARRVLK